MSDEYYAFISISRYNKDGKEFILEKRGKHASGTDNLKAVLSGFYNSFMRLIREELEGFKPETLKEVKNKQEEDMKTNLYR